MEKCSRNTLIIIIIIINPIANSNNNINDNKCISRAPFHVKHAQLR